MGREFGVGNSPPLVRGGLVAVAVGVAVALALAVGVGFYWFWCYYLCTTRDLVASRMKEF